MADIVARVDSLENTVRGVSGTVGLVGDVSLLKSRQAGMEEALETHRCEIYGTLTTAGLKADMKSLTDFKVVVADFMTEIQGMFTKLVLAVIGTVIGGIIIQLLMNSITWKQSTP